MRQETPPRAPSPWSRPLPAALVAIAAAVVAASAAVGFHRWREDRRHAVTGRAVWIWYERAGRKPSPLVFTATREVVLDAAPRRAVARFCVDPAYALYVNGERVAQGACRPGDPLAVEDLGSRLVKGANRIAIEASSPDGIGGILFAVEGEGFDPDVFASSERWKVRPGGVTAGGAERSAVAWGRPPQSPWGYPRLPGGR